jgi:hypothetical protein
VGEHAFLQVQFCLTDAASAAELKHLFQNIARAEGLTFGDRSADTEIELRAMKDHLPPDVRRSFPIINIGVESAKGWGASAGNAGLPANQVSVGFGPDSPEARRFAERTVRRLRQTWTVFTVPEGRGAFALKDCATGT